jgi:hypothetical protein
VNFARLFLNALPQSSRGPRWLAHRSIAAANLFGVRGLIRAFGRRLVAVACRGAPGTPRTAERGSAWPTSRPGAKSGDESPHSKCSAHRVIPGKLLNRYYWPPFALLSLTRHPARHCLSSETRPRPEP